jgi:integrase
LKGFPNSITPFNSYLNKEGKLWNPPRYRRTQKIPFIPTEKELDQLISSSGKKLSIYLQCCKETGADPGELLHIEWIDVNKENSTITINHPVKGHNARIIPVSTELIGRLETLPKKSERVFSTISMYPNLYTQRKRATKKFNNPRLLKISFVTIRHWKGTMEYHRTKDILHVKQLLGHKQIQNTMVYINLENAVFND